MFFYKPNLDYTFYIFQVLKISRAIQFKGWLVEDEIGIFCNCVIK